MSDSSSARRIRPLGEAVVNKIAAGEIIERPENAVKELIENSLDSESTIIDVLLKEGGLKLLQISDNGTGIYNDDLPLLCQRFSTSKITKFEDLSSVKTFGFRGEALASISHISRLTVTTKRKDAVHGWRAFYIDGKLAPATGHGSSAPQPCAGKQGTVVSVEDLFYNVPSRKVALKNGAEEFRRILLLIQKYAIHNESVSFSCKKFGDSAATLSLSSRFRRIDRIRQVYGSNLAKNLLPFEVYGGSLLEGFSAQGLVSNANYASKKTVFLLFINNRLVESTDLRKNLEEVYSEFLPKGASPFLYLSLNIPESQVDVNVHPSKRVVHFLHDQEIADLLRSHLSKVLENEDARRSYHVQTVLPSTTTMLKTPESNRQGRPSHTVYEHHMVRTDPREQSIKTLMNRHTPTSSQKTPACGPASEATDYEASPTPVASKSLSRSNLLQSEDKVYRTEVNYKSILELREEVLQSMHVLTTNILTEHKYVGLVCPERGLCVIQYNIGLFLVDYLSLSFELFYQIGLSEFCNFGCIKLEPSISVRTLLELGLPEQDEVDGETKNKSELLEKTERLLLARREMLSEYFQLTISPEGQLESIPMLHAEYSPFLEKLPWLLADLAPHKIEWLEEKACFAGILKAIARFYVPVKLDSENAKSDEVERIVQLLEEILFPEFKRRLLCSKRLMDERKIFQVTSLPRLYTVFERC
ncbi:MutL family protein Mlh1 [Schizosaccharomyces japonicus yFS275]|uniref:MutL family protein Mlh1 n=1 Tax=Schizosaccharomyces japonicus (strain yFS275 / FY16936) TaxID=402676 RepID=B6JYF8_SCHJY|nr:MutL family protein Mlh1 [Schizosaccharomyces japonicus yFS275]EEB06576.1 MutL family protein Mlh1 [Schizosaccharomyces japonicus yFS275]